MEPAWCGRPAPTRGDRCSRSPFPTSFRATDRVWRTAAGRGAQRRDARLAGVESGSARIGRAVTIAATTVPRTAQTRDPSYAASAAAAPAEMYARSRRDLYKDVIGCLGRFRHGRGNVLDQARSTRSIEIDNRLQSLGPSRFGIARCLPVLSGRVLLFHDR